MNPGHEFRNLLQDGRPGPKMVVIPAGDFLMGSPSGENNARRFEFPQHNVTIPHAFAVGKFPVTFDEFDHFITSSGYAHNPFDEGWGRGSRPVIDVSWKDAVAYCNWLCKQTGFFYRLLSEAEWEYACRAGTTTRFWWGNEIEKNRCNCQASASRWSGEKTSPVDAFKANPYGLYDVHGNVTEWVDDMWSLYDGTEEVSCERIVRGGSWETLECVTRSACRSGLSVQVRANCLGFRVARSLFIETPVTEIGESLNGGR